MTHYIRIAAPEHRDIPGIRTMLIDDPVVADVDTQNSDAAK